MEAGDGDRVSEFRPSSPRRITEAVNLIATLVVAAMDAFEVTPGAT
jgi:hypothetical protein